MGDGLDLGNEERRTGLGVPDDVEIDFGIVIAGHDDVPDDG